MNRIFRKSFSFLLSKLGKRYVTTSGIQYKRRGDPNEKLEWGDFETKMSLEDEGSVLVKMVAAPINPSDISMIEGTYGDSIGNLPRLPAIGGNEGVGIVKEVGSGVDNLKIGDWVIPLESSHGTWCFENVFHKDNLFQLGLSVGEDISLEMASTIRINPVTAYRMIHDYVDLDEGDSLILNGCNSQVGRSVLQIAEAKGLKTIGIMRDRLKFDDYVDEIKGVDILEKEEYVFMYVLNSPWLEENKPKLALDCVGNGSARNLYRALDEGGVLVTYGEMSGESFEVSAKDLIFNRLTLTGFWLDDLDKESVIEGLNEVLKLVEKGEFVMDFYQTCKFGETEFFESLDSVLKGSSSDKGKMIMIMDESFL